MQEHYRKWYTPYFEHEFEMLVFGHAGIPIILFPTSQGKYYQNKDFGLLDSIAWYVNQGIVKVYCPDSRDEMSWYNKSIHPADRVNTHLAYERIIMHEVAMAARNETGIDKVIFAGASFGGYHAMNFGLKFPQFTSHIISMSGAFDMRSFMDGYYSDEFYYNNPVDFVGGMSTQTMSQQYGDLSIIVGVAEDDACKEDNFNFSKLLKEKGVSHWFDFWEGHSHDWPIWREKLPLYLSKLKYD
jgi:esterase/lipase superfamily enzyme